VDRERVWGQVTDERRAVLDLLEELTPAEWDAPTLCAGWRVRELVAHLTMPTRTGPLAATVGLARARFDVDRYFAEWAVEHGRAPTAELLQQWRDVVTSGRRPRDGTPGGVLVETVAHAQDLRRPLGRPAATPPDRLRTALDVAVRRGRPFRGRQRAAGLRWVGTDVDWTWGTPGDPEVRGHGDDLLLAMLGRPAVLRDLSGTGVVRLAG
jgi:uncharacterized protein (TIGR03083 family)